jgi:D-alanyl-D-alanine carboxypeptidase (penicillin-binding protein 5/6)
MAKKSFRKNKYWWVACREKIVFLCLLAIIFVVTPQKQGTVAIASFPEIPQKHTNTLPIPSPAPYPMNTTGIQPPEVTAHAVDIVDVQSGVSLYTKNDREPLAPASTTKIMTAMVALDHFNPDDIITIREATLSSAVMDLIPNERITVENLLYGLLIPSSNDAAYALAEFFPGGESAFMEEMNRKAKELGLTQTNFTNPVGFDDPNHIMSAHDLARMSRLSMQYPLISKIVAIPAITVSDEDHMYFHTLRTTNQLLGIIPGVSGIKTGSTPMAGENLVTLVERNGKKVIIIALNSQDRFTDTESLINWVFSNHQWIQYGL